LTCTNPRIEHVSLECSIKKVDKHYEEILLTNSWTTHLYDRDQLNFSQRKTRLSPPSPTKVHTYSQYRTTDFFSGAILTESQRIFTESQRLSLIQISSVKTTNLRIKQMEVMIGLELEFERVWKKAAWGLATPPGKAARSCPKQPEAARGSRSSLTENIGGQGRGSRLRSCRAAPCHNIVNCKGSNCPCSTLGRQSTQASYTICLLS